MGDQVIHHSDPLYARLFTGIDKSEDLSNISNIHSTYTYCPHCKTAHDCYCIMGTDIYVDINEYSITHNKLFAKPVMQMVCTKNDHPIYFTNEDTMTYEINNEMYEIDMDYVKDFIERKKPIMNEENKTIDYEDEIKDIKERINSIPSSISVGEISDRYHTFNELYHHRALLFASLCMTTFRDKAWKSLLHDDPENNPMYNGMFIVGVDTPFGQATYHYDIYPYWNIFKVKEVETAPKFDGHTPNDAIDRLYKYAMKIAEESSITINIKDGPYGYNNVAPCADYGKTGGVPNFNTYYTGSTITD